jgi:Ca2+-binding RTX toxin-like protein
LGRQRSSSLGQPLISPFADPDISNKGYKRAEGSKMVGTLRRRKRGGGRALLIAAAAVLSISLMAGGSAALAKKINGSKRGESLAGTKGPDKIKGKAGNDRLKGKAGNDLLNGGKDRDTVIGGPGADRMLGGPGDDLINAADGARDSAIDGGAGTNTCVLDTNLELAIARGCSAIRAGSVGGAPGPGQGLQVLTVNGLVGCTAVPICLFTITGNGADAPVGTVTGTGGVNAGGASVTVSGSDWTASGLYGCTSDGALRVTIGSESFDVPVDCAL